MYVFFQTKLSVRETVSAILGVWGFLSSVSKIKCQNKKVYTVLFKK